MDVFAFEDGDGWLSGFEHSLVRFESRSAAFAAARDILRQDPDARLITGRPSESDHPAPDPPSPETSQPPAKPRPDSRARPLPAGPTSDSEWVRLAGPPELGRSILLLAGIEAPGPWRNSTRVVVGGDSPDRLQGRELLDTVRRAFLGRTPVVYEVPAGDWLAAPDPVADEIWRLSVDFEHVEETAWSLMTANAIDARDLEHAHLGWTESAIAAGGAPSDRADAVLADGTHVFCDGGPFRLWERDELDGMVIPTVTIECRALPDGLPAAVDVDLAPDQLEAVHEPGATSRIIAPAGSGKTRVLTERARYLLRARQIPAKALTLIAYNKRAQEEMRDRTGDLPGLQVQTLNALALAILNGTQRFRRRGETVRTADEIAVRNILADMVKFPRRANTDPAAAWIEALSLVRLGLRDPEEVEAGFGGDVDGFAEFFPRYRGLLKDRGLVDFDEQIYRAIEVLVNEPETRADAQLVCRLMLVDEFQDLTPAHLLLIRLLAGPRLNVFGVGDDDQTIYGYSGASPDWLIDFDRFFPGSTAHALHVNYRCPPEVVSASVNLLSHNRHRILKKIGAAPTRASNGASLRLIRHKEPVDATVSRVLELIDAGAQPSDVAVLSRVNSLLVPVQLALAAHDVPTLSVAGRRFTERTGVAAALSWLALATGTGRLSGRDVQQAGRRPGRGLSPRVLEWMAEQQDISGLERLASRLKNPKDTEKVLGFAKDLVNVQQMATAETADMLRFIRSEIGLDRALQTLDIAHRGQNTVAHADDLRGLLALGRLHPDPSTFGAWLRTSLDEPSAATGVTLSSVHRVKGLEWPHIVVHDATQKIFPHHLSTDIEEERRVFHVAVTRSQLSTTVVADSADPSMFLAELEQRAVAPIVKDEDPRAPSGTDAAATRQGRRKVPAVPATIGMSMSWGGYDGEITSVEADNAVLSTGSNTFLITFDSIVEVAGVTHRLGAPSTGRARRTSSGRAVASVDASAANPAVFEALKAWRLKRARVDKVPAFVVAKDATLVELAIHLPTTDAELLAIRGIGPAKLEQYGDQMRAIIEESA